MKILVASERFLLRAGMRSILSELGEGLTILEARDFPDALTKASEHPDLCLVLLGLDAAGRIGEVAIVDLRARHPALRIIAVAPHVIAGEVISAFASGARGYVPETISRQVFIDAVRLVMSGGVYIPQELLCGGGPILVERAATRHNGGGADLNVKGVRHVGGLTPKQAQVLELMAQGKPNKLIGRELGLAPGTVKAHVAGVLRALNVRNRTEAAVAAGGALGFPAATAHLPHSSRIN